MNYSGCINRKEYMTKYIIIETKHYQYSSNTVKIVDEEAYDKETAEAVMKACKLKNKDNEKLSYYMVQLKPEQLNLPFPEVEIAS